MKNFFDFLIVIFITCTLTSCSTPKTNPTAADYNVALGLSYLKKNNVEAAKSKLLLALQQSPQNPVVQDAFGYFLEQTAEPAQAQVYYLKALQLAPKAGSSQNNYGAFLCRQGKYQLAITHFLLAAQDLNYLHPAQAYANAGLCALRIPNVILAREYFEKALKADPNNSRALFELQKLSYNHSAIGSLMIKK